MPKKTSSIWNSKLQVVHRRTSIKIAYAAHERDQRNRRTNPITKIARLRLAELERLFSHRYGRTLPDDDSGRDDLLLAVHHIVGAGIDVARRVRYWARLWAPWCSPDDATALAEQAIACPLRFKAATLGRHLRLTEVERIMLKIKTIRAIDATENAVARKRRLDRERGKRKRAEARAEREAQPRQPKPWQAAGISRATWYRRVRQKPAANISLSNIRDANLSHDSRPHCEEARQGKVPAEFSRFSNPDHHSRTGSSSFAGRAL